MSLLQKGSLIRRVPRVEQELFTLPEHLSSLKIFSGGRVTRHLVLYVCFVDQCLSFCTFFFWPLFCLFFIDIRILITPLVSFDHCFVCSSSIYGFWLPIWYLLTIVLSVLHRYTDSDYPFGIFKLFLKLVIISFQSDDRRKALHCRPTLF